jgi:hypothetical protein
VWEQDWCQLSWAGCARLAGEETWDEGVGARTSMVEVGQSKRMYLLIEGHGVGVHGGDPDGQCGNRVPSGFGHASDCTGRAKIGRTY